MTPDFLKEWLREHPRTRAIICDIDDTICSAFDVPFGIAVQTLGSIDRSIEVHYVTARPESARAGTERFLQEHRLPSWRSLHFCPSWQSSRLHKSETIARLARHYQVLVGIGDHDEEEQASRAAGIPFVRVTDATIEQAWLELAKMLSQPAS